MNTSGLRSIEGRRLDYEGSYCQFPCLEVEGLRLLRPVTLNGVRRDKGESPRDWLPLLARHVKNRTALVA
jgi:hypothetical protein